MAGLDNIKHYEEGSAVEADTSTTPTAPLSAKAAPSKYLPTPTSATGVDPALLQNMQQLIDEREAQRSGLMESLKDATAWWSGGVAGPGEALSRRAKEREEQALTTFGMKRDLAQYKVAQQQAQNLQNKLFGDTPAAAAPSAATAPGQVSQPGTVAPTTTAAPQQGGLLNLVRDPGLQQSIAVQAQTDQNGALKSIQAYLAKNAEDPQLVKEVNAAVAKGWLDPKLVPSVVLTKMAGSGAFVPHDVRGVQGTSQTTPLAAASAANQPTPGAPVVPTPAVAKPTLVTPPAPPPGVNVTKPVAPVAAPATPVAPKATVPAAPVVPGQQPLVSSSLQTGFAPGSKEDLETKAEAAKSKIRTQEEQQKPIEKGAGESAVALTKSMRTAKDNIQQYDMAESILRQYPKAFGISQDGSATAAVIQLVKPGTTIPILGTVKSEGIEEAIAQKRLPPKALAARATFDALSTRFGTQYANQYLTGEGRGTLSNSDMKMAQVAKGLDKSSPAASNLIFAILNREQEQMLLEQGQGWTKYQEEARKAGQTPDFNRYTETDTYQKAQDKKEERIQKRFPEFFKVEAAPESKTAHPGESLVEKYKSKKAP